MIELTTGDILSSDSEALVNTVNCVGVSGRGIALQFRKAFPENFKAYAAACKLGEVQPGRMFVHDTGRLTNPRYIINFPTKRHWRGNSRIEDIDLGLEDLVRQLERRAIKSVAVPPLGSGLGGLDWTDVRPRIEAALRKVEDLEATVFEPSDVPQRAKGRRTAPKMTAGRAALVGLMRRYLSGFMDPSVSLLEVHKLMYFMQEAGEKLRLRFSKAPYGPYAENLRHVLSEVEGYYVSGYYDGGDDPEKQLELVPGASEEADRFLARHPKTSSRFEQVGDLVEGFESSFGLELLASVHWLAVHGETRTPDRAVKDMYVWGNRKRQFSTDQIELAWNVLDEKGWLTRTSEI